MLMAVWIPYRMQWLGYRMIWGLDPGWDIFLISNVQASSMVHPLSCSVKLTLKSACSYISVPSYVSSWHAQGQLYLQIFTVVFLNKQVLFPN